MKKILIIALMLVLSIGLIGCASDYAGNVVMINPQPDVDNPLRYIQDDFEIQFRPLVEDYIGFKVNAIEISLENKTKDTIRVIWDDSTFVNVDGTSSKLVTGNMRYIDLNDPVPASRIPGNAKNSSTVIPRNNIYWSDGVQRDPIILVRSSEAAEKYDGKTISILIPIEKEGEVKEYRFDFEISVVYIGDEI